MGLTFSPRAATSLLVPAEGVRLAVARGTALLLVPAREGLFRADPAIPPLWPRLCAGLDEAAFIEAARAARRDGPALLAQLLGAGVLVRLGTDRGPVPVAARLGVDLGHLRLALNFTAAEDAAALAGMLAHLQLPAEECPRQMLVLGRGRKIGIGPGGTAPAWSPRAQAGPALKVALTDAALAALEGIALHVATLSRGDEALLLVGAPGAGKSTLSVALGASGFRLEGDDIAALEPGGRVRGLAFPATVKDGAWPLLARHRPDLARQPAYRRPDGQRVRYLPLVPGAPPPRRVRAVLCLERRAGPGGLTPLGVEEGVAALLEGAWSADRRLAPRDFDALMRCVDGAAFHRMRYATLDEGLSLSRTAWQRAAAPRAALAR